MNDDDIGFARNVVRLALVQARMELESERHEDFLRREREIFLSGLFPREAALESVKRVTASVRQLQQKKLQVAIEKQALLAKIQQAERSRIEKTHVGRHGLNH